MPSKFGFLVSFLTVTALSVGLHIVVFRKLQSLILRDFAKIGPRLVFWARIVFIYFDLPFVFLFVRGWIDTDLSMLSRLLLYPFVVWQFLLGVWSLILGALWVVKTAQRKISAA